MILVHVRAWRLQRQLSLQTLAQRSGVPQGALSLIEQGRRTDLRLSTLERLAQALGVSPQALLAPPPPLTLNRAEREAVAQTIVHDAPLAFPQYESLVNDMAHVVSCKLRAFQAPGTRRIRGQRWRVNRRLDDVRARYGESLVREVLSSVEIELLALERHGRLTV